MNENTKEVAKKGITFGTCLAMVISYANWHSVGWAIVHGLMSWLYVIYFVLHIECFPVGRKKREVTF